MKKIENIFRNIITLLLMDSPEVIACIKNIIKNQRKFNYDSIPNISNFADITDKKGISPLFYYCKKGKEDKTLELLDSPILKLSKSNDYFDEAAYNRMSKTCLKMLEKKIFPFNFGETFAYCLDSKMEDVAVELLNHFDVVNDIIIIKGNKIINPIIYCIKNKLEKILVHLLQHYSYFDNYNFNGHHIFYYASKYNNEMTVKYAIENKKLGNEVYDEKSLSYLFINRNDNYLYQVLVYIINNNNNDKLFVRDFLNKKIGNGNIFNFNQCNELLNQLNKQLQSSFFDSSKLLFKKVLS